MSSSGSNNTEIERESRQRVIREAKRHVYVKRESVPRDQVSHLPVVYCSTHKEVVARYFYP